MRTRSFAFQAPLLLALTACGGNTSSSSGSSPTDPGSVPIAKSSLARDAASSIAASSLSGAVAANNAFALDLYAHLQTGSTSNLLTSPISASLALTMTYAGAKTETATQMASALHYGAAAGTIFDGQNALSQALASRGAAALAGDQKTATEEQQPAPSASDYQLQVVNSVWGEKTYTWESPFLDILARSYGTGVYQEDFVNAPDAARQTINAWVSDATADKINNLIPTGAIDTTTRMVLVNAIHLKLPWETPFQASATATANFTTGAGTTVAPSFMNMTASFSYTDDGNAQTVALPLAGGQVAVLISLPHGALSTYEAGLAPGSPAITMPTTGSLVSLSLPKVAFTAATFSLKTVLETMGMTDAFDKSLADFTGLAAPQDGEHLYIEDVLQKSMIAMQETGVEAAAATAVLVGETAGVGGPAPVPIPMVVNKPFVLSIVDVPTGAVLFLGHIEDPTDAGSP